MSKRNTRINTLKSMLLKLFTVLKTRKNIVQQKLKHIFGHGIRCLAFFGLWLPVIFCLVLEMTRFTKSVVHPAQIKKKQVADYHKLVVFTGLLNFVKNEHELAAVISHEFAHLELQHTLMTRRTLYREYHADMMSMYYMLKAGYNPCVISRLWKRMNQNMINLKPRTHPLKVSRTFYMKLPTCQNYVLEDKRVTAADVLEVYNRVAAAVEARIRFNTHLIIKSSHKVNAYVTTTMRKN